MLHWTSYHISDHSEGFIHDIELFPGLEPAVDVTE